jgi:hypothetical protein
VQKTVSPGRASRYVASRTEATVPLESAVPGAVPAARCLLGRQGQAGARFLHRERAAHRNPSTAVSAHWRLPRPSPTLGDHNPFQHHTEQELLQGVVLGLMQGAKSERSLHNCVCGPMEEHFPGAHLRGVATRSRASSPVAGSPLPSALAHHPSLITGVKSLPRRQPAAHHHLSGSANFE